MRRLLGALDSKIELLGEQGRTLESMARALFKSWFVDFDPVRAKAEGRGTELPAEIAELFPDGFEESEVGEIPRGWRVGALSDIAHCNPEAWAPATRPATIDYVDLGGVKWGRLEKVERYASSAAPSRAQRVLRKHDTIVGTVRPGNGSYAYILRTGLTGSTGFAVLRPLEQRNASFLYLAATSLDKIAELEHLADGGAYPAVSAATVAALRTLLPSEAVLRHFDSIAGALLARIQLLENEVDSLKTVRDALLPRLLSGNLVATARL